MKQIGITGANGFIGSHLLRSAIAAGRRPIALVQRDSSLAPIADLAGRYDLVDGDLLDPASLDVFAARCSTVFHLAGLNRYWASNPADFHDVNVKGVRAIARACLRHRVSRFVHVSSCITLGASDVPVGRDEHAPYNLRFPFLYAETKKAGEEVVMRLAREDGLPAVIVNPTSAIGECDFGPTPIGRPIADIAGGSWPVYVAGGACFIDVHDVVRGLWLALDRGTPGRKYLLVGENMTSHQFMSVVAEIAGAPKPRIRVPRSVLAAAGLASEWLADRVTKRHPRITAAMSGLIGKYLYFDGARAKQELGFRARPVAPAIERCIRWFREAAR